MNTKHLIPAIGILLLSSSALALADDGWHGRHESGPSYHSPHDRDRDRDFRSHGYDFDDHHATHGPRWFPPYGHGYSVPQWRPYHYSYYYYPNHEWGSRAYDRDGVTIIFRGHLN